MKLFILSPCSLLCTYFYVMVIIYALISVMDIKCACPCHGYQMCTDFCVMVIICTLISMSWLSNVYRFQCHGYQMCTDFCVMVIICALISMLQPSNVHWFLCHSQMCTDFCATAIKCALISKWDGGQRPMGGCLHQSCVETRVQDFILSLSYV